MQNISTLPLRQESFLESKKHDKINNSVSHGTIELISHKLLDSTMPSLEEISVAKAKKLLQKMLLPTKEAAQVFSNLEAAREAKEIFKQRTALELPSNITETPKFHEAKTESLELSDSAKETFARIGIRVREAFIEEQIERASLYNIPYENYSDNYYQLMVDIDKYD